MWRRWRRDRGEGGGEKVVGEKVERRRWWGENGGDHVNGIR